MATITFTIDNGKIDRIIDAMKGLFPIPTIADPEWEDPEDGSFAPLINEFTDNEWAKEALRRYTIDVVHRFEKKEAKDLAHSSITKDDELVS